MTLCCFAVLLESNNTAYCPLCGAKFCNIHALDEHFTIYHDGRDGLIPSEKKHF